jgi:hypothetical protein
MKKGTIIALLLLSVAGVVVWWQRTPLLAWYYVRGLTGTDEGGRDTWVNRAAGLDSAILPRLLDCLEDVNAQVCKNITAGLLRLAERWEVEDGRTLELAEELQARFDRLSSAGQIGVLEVMTETLRRSPPRAAPPRLTRAAGDLLMTTAAMPDLRRQVLALGGMLVEHVQPGQWRDVCQELAIQSFKDARPEMRVGAVTLLVHLARAGDSAFLQRLVPLLRDPVPPVRRAAVLAAGASREAVPDDDLLPLLHDPDAEVRRLVELALRSRGLHEDHILLARLISDQRPAARLQVLDHLRNAADLEPGVWLRRLSEDSAPAVRAAAVRAAYYQTQVDLRERLQQMARQDPSPTVRQLAAYYLTKPTPRRFD